MLKKIKNYLSKYKELFIKICISVSVLLLILTFGSLLSTVFSLRPQTVIFLLFLGHASTNAVLKQYERVVNGYEDPLPKYILEDIEKKDKEIESIKNMIANDDRFNITKSEIEVMAKKELYKDDKEED